MIELSRTQDEEVGDGTTSVIVLGMCWTSVQCFVFVAEHEQLTIDLF